MLKSRRCVRERALPSGCSPRPEVTKDPCQRRHLSRKALSFLGPYWGPFVGAICAAPLVFVGGALLHKFLISRVSGLRTAGTLDEGHFGQLVVTLGISLILQNGGQILFGSTPVAVRTPLSSEAFLIGPVYHGATVFLNKAKLVAFFVAVLAAVVLYVTLEYTRLG